MIGIIHGIAWDVLIASSLLLVGVALGRQLGLRQERHLAAKNLPLMLRKQLYSSGQCPVCDTTFFVDDTIEEKGVVEHERKSDLGRTAKKHGIG